MKNIRSHFPIFHHRKPIIYLDNAATTHKPQSVIDAVVKAYAQDYAPVKRGLYQQAEAATTHLEAVRSQVARFINARQSSEIVFTSGTTDGITMIAQSWGKQHIGPEDVIVISELEHHANLLPWQRLAQDTGAQLRYIPVNFDGSLSLQQIEDIITSEVKLVAITHTSNAVGTRIDLAPIVAAARKVGAAVLVDAAQAAGYEKLDVQALGVDFLVFSGHKMMGPTGVGVAYIAQKHHKNIQPYRLGGGMVFEVGAYQATWLEMPHLLEAGTPAIAEIQGLGAAIDFLEHVVTFETLARQNKQLMNSLIDQLSPMDHIVLLGPLDDLREHGHMVSFMVDGMHAHDVATYLDHKGIAVRAGDHCAQLAMKKMGIASSVRVSIYAYTIQEDIDALCEALRTIDL